MKTLILALGNPILSDDGVAHEVADRLAKHLQKFRIQDSKLETETERESNHGPRDVQYDIVKSSAATMDIIPDLAGYEQLVVIDAVQMGSAAPGTVYRFKLADLASTVRRSSPHDINFATALQMGETWGYAIPAEIRIYGIEVKELLRFSEGCTPEVREKLDEIVEQILSDLTK